MSTNNLIETNYENTFDYCINEMQMIYKTIKFSDYLDYNYKTDQEFRTKCKYFLSEMFDKINQSFNGMFWRFID